MTIQEARRLLRQIKKAIQKANDQAEYDRVRWLKAKKFQIRQKINFIHLIK